MRKEKAPDISGALLLCAFPVEVMTETKQVNLIIYLTPDKIHYLDKYLLSGDRLPLLLKLH